MMSVFVGRAVTPASVRQFSSALNNFALLSTARCQRLLARHLRLPALSEIASVYQFCPARCQRSSARCRRCSARHQRLLTFAPNASKSFDIQNFSESPAFYNFHQLLSSFACASLALHNFALRFSNAEESCQKLAGVTALFLKYSRVPTKNQG